MASLVEKYGWHEWLCHTNFSFLVGASHPAEYVERAVKLGYASLAITDYDGVYGIARAYRARKKLFGGSNVQDDGFKLCYGTEIHLAKDHELSLTLQDTLALYALTHKGYFNLCRFLTYAHREGKTEAMVSFDYLMAEDMEDVVAVLPMRGVLRRQEGKDEKAVTERLISLKEHFPGRFFLAVGRLLHRAEDKWISATLGFSRELEIPTLLSQDVFFHDRERKPLSDLLQAVRCNITLDQAAVQMFPNARRCLHSLEALERIYSALPIYERSLIAARELAERFEFDLDLLRYNYPKEMIPEGHDAQSYLELLTWRDAKRVYGEELSEKISGLLKHELALVKKLSFADYFLTVWDIVCWARRQGILCQGRGSAANSAVCYVLGITAVDPGKFDLLFERFISVERGEPPDIDVDFEHERREEVIQYIYERFGRSRSAMVANVITFRTRGAIRAAGKALGMPEVILGRAAKILENRTFRWSETKETIGQVRLEYLKSCGGGSSPEKPPDHLWDVWAKMSEELRGFPRHLGIHSGGFIISDKDLSWLLPQEPATMEGRTVIEWCKEDIEALGFFKIDILALGILSAIRKCLGLLKSNYGKDMALTAVPSGDAKTYEMICRGDTVGVFQIESRAQISMLPRLRPRNFYDLVVEVAIIRPGPIQGKMIHPYLRRRNGQEPVTFPDQRLEPILRRTFGIPIFQEQVMRVAMAVGDFTAGEADELRKNIGSFKLQGDVNVWIGSLEQGMRRNGIAEDFIQSILEQIRGFSSYGFPESHAASFALLAYASAYLKRYYPAAYFTSMINSQPMGFYAPDTLIKTARRSGVTVLPILVNESDYEAKLEKIGPNDWGIRLGLHMVRGLSEAGAKKMVEARESRGKWRDPMDLLMNCRLNRLDFTALAAAGTLSAFRLERRAAIWLSEAVPYSKYLEDVEDKVFFRKETEMELVQADYHFASTSLGRHPAEILREEGTWVYDVSMSKIVLANDMLRAVNGSWIYAFGLVLVRQAPPTAGGMMFITLEDETGMVNLVVRPHIYRKYSSTIDGQAFLCVLGKVEKNDGAMNLMVSQFAEPALQKAEVIPLYPKGDAEWAECSSFDLSRNYM